MSNNRRLLALVLLIGLAGTAVLSLTLSAFSFHRDLYEYNDNRPFTTADKPNARGDIIDTYDVEMMTWETYHPKNHPWALLSGSLIGLLATFCVVVYKGLYTSEAWVPRAKVV